jgi:hypothetical protein
MKLKIIWVLKPLNYTYIIHIYYVSQKEENWDYDKNDDVLLGEKDLDKGSKGVK